jgi:hypothetical protein
MVGGGVNGYIQTGTIKGFARGFASGALPDDMGFDAYYSNAAANIGIGIFRDGVKGSIVEGNIGGFRKGVLIGQSNNLIGHIVGLSTTGQMPYFEGGVFYYRGNFWDVRGGR